MHRIVPSVLQQQHGNNLGHRWQYCTLTYKLQSPVRFVNTPIDNHFGKFAGPEKGRLFQRGRYSFMAIRLVCLTGDVGLRAPVEIDVGYGVLANAAAAELVVWLQCGSCRKLPGRRAWLLEDVWSRSTVTGVAAAVPVARCVGHDHLRAKAASLMQ
ncbi:hypothetical protein B7P43_G07970 [Cryptotermes secundus]|uniref:Uncharacterized protein n=1 Tax=Cryptotermes secundus TaxID=105785 RepID=A0A2J7RI96_9NEOP|nr:hypothetical protein B7P43_G07970 [Cryptotermes secundus]